LVSVWRQFFSETAQRNSMFGSLTRLPVIRESMPRFVISWELEPRVALQLEACFWCLLVLGSRYLGHKEAGAWG